VHTTPSKSDPVTLPHIPVLALPKRRLVLLLLVAHPSPRPLLVPLDRRLGDGLTIEEKKRVAVVVVEASAAPQPGAAAVSVGVGLIDGLD